MANDSSTEIDSSIGHVAESRTRGGMFDGDFLVTSSCRSSEGKLRVDRVVRGVAGSGLGVINRQ